MEPYVESKVSQWMQHGNCRSAEFIVLADTKAEKEISKKTCQGCPVISDCLDHALKNNEYGIWAGTTEKDRRNIKNLRNRKKA